MVIFVGIMLSVFQQAVGINAVLYFAPRIFETMGMANPMVQTVLMGVVNILFTLLAVFTVEKMGTQTAAYFRFCRYGDRSFRCGYVQRRNRTAGNNIRYQHHGLQRFVHVQLGTYLLGTDCRNLPEHHPWRCGSHCGGIPMDFQLIVSSTFLPMYNMRIGEMGDKFGHMFAYALYGIICVAAALFVWKLVPETKGKTLEDMTKLWKKRNKSAGISIRQNIKGCAIHLKGIAQPFVSEVPDFWCLPPGGTAHTIRWYDDFHLMVRRVPY